MSKKDVLIAYKGFDKDFKCRDFQYEVGKTYAHPGDVKLYNTGFHACEAPFDCWNYYKPADGAQYAQVEMADVSDKKDSDTKRVAKSITVKVKLTIPMLIKAQVEWVISKADKSVATGDSGHAAATGDSGHAAATGNSGHAAATGNYGHAAATGYSGHAAATGNYGHAAATGNYGHAAATGDSGHASATGYSGHAAATGGYGHAAATGDYGCAFAGFWGKAKASHNGSFAIAWYDEENKRSHILVGIVGEKKIKADTWYQVKNGKLVEG